MKMMKDRNDVAITEQVKRAKFIGRLIPTH